MSPGKREIGDPLEQVMRTGKLGSASGGQPAGSPATQVSGSPEVETSGNLSFQKSSTLDTQKSGSLATQSVGSPEVQKSSNVATQTVGNSEVQTSSNLETQTASSPEGKQPRVQRTIYLSPALAKWVKIRAAMEDREISELAEDAFSLYRQHIERGNNG